MTKVISILLLIALSACNDSVVVVPINKISSSGVAESIGSVTLKQSGGNVELTPNLKSLTPGEHGFHLHENPSCEPKEKDGKMVAGGAAGNHFDPNHTGKHEGPDAHGHKGDLPKLIVNENGTATNAVVIKNLTLGDFKNKSLVIHAGGDNYSDSPQPLGGGGDRVACGVVK